MEQKVLCEVCQEELKVINPPLPPQICNGAVMSTVAMLNGRAECLKCGAKYITQIINVSMNLGFRKIEEESRIIKANTVPVPLTLVK